MFIKSSITIGTGLLKGFWTSAHRIFFSVLIGFSLLHSRPGFLTCPNVFCSARLATPMLLCLNSLQAVLLLNLSQVQPDLSKIRVQLRCDTGICTPNIQKVSPLLQEIILSFTFPWVILFWFCAFGCILFFFFFFLMESVYFSTVLFLSSFRL